MTTTSAFLQQTFWVPGVLCPRVLPAPAHDGWSPPAFPLRPAQTVPRLAPASRGSHLPAAGGAGRRARGQALLTGDVGTNENRTEEKATKFPTTLFSCREA